MFSLEKYRMLEDKIKRNQFIFLVTLVVFIFLARLFYVQIIDKEYSFLSDKNILREVTVFPSRGYIYDRNGKLLAKNNTIYDLAVIPSLLSRSLILLFFWNIWIFQKKSLKK